MNFDLVGRMAYLSLNGSYATVADSYGLFCLYPETEEYMNSGGSVWYVRV